MKNKKEENILRLIKYAPMVLVVFLSITLTYLFLLNKTEVYKKNRIELQNLYIETSKKAIKDDVHMMYNYIRYEKENNEKVIRTALVRRTNEIYKIINSLYEEYHKNYTQEEVIGKIKDFLHNYKLNEGVGDLYLYSLDSNTFHFIDNEGKIENFRKMIAISKKMSDYFKKKQDPTFFNIESKNQEDDEENKTLKIFYSKIFKPYNLVIATGEYMDIYIQKLKSKILSYVNYQNYLKNGYIFILDYDGKIVSHFYKKFININIFYDKNQEENSVAQKVINLAKKGEGFLSYKPSLNPQITETVLKTAFIKGFDDWRWAIGNGFYMDDINKELVKIHQYTNAEQREDVLNIILISSIFTFLAMFFSFYSSHLLRKMFFEHKEELLKYINDNRKKDSILAQQSKMVAVGEMIQNISHQWRQPLSTISTVSSGIKLKKTYGILEDEELDKGLEKVLYHTQYLSQTIDDFRDYFSPDKEEQSFDISKTVDKCLKLLDVQLSANNIKAINNIDSLYICSRESLLIQVLLNLLSNAKDEFTDKEKQEKFIFIDAKKEDKIIITVKDNAGGVIEKNMNKIFDVYFSTKNKQNGSGIGLYMVDEIIKGLNGSIQVRNEKYIYKGKSYKGAVFEIILPISKC